MRRFIVHSFAFIGVCMVLLSITGLVAVLTYRAPKPSVPDSAVIRFDFGQNYDDVAADDPISRFRGEGKAGFLDLMATLTTATSDPRVKGLIADVDGVSMSFAHVQELREALVKFRAAGKFAYAYGETLSGNKDIYLASAFDQISVQPMGGLGLKGLIVERLFLRGTLDKFGIEPEVERRRDYKSFADAYLFNAFTSSEREMILSFVGSISTQMIEGIAKGRGLSVDEVRALIDRGPFTTEDALKSRLIDRIAFADEVREAALAKAAPEGASDSAKAKIKIMAGGRYSAAVRSEPKSGSVKVAVVPISGAIVPGDGPNNLSGDQVAAGNRIAKAINRAIEDKDVKAILVRVNSPGGSPTASDTIRHAMIKAKKAGKPVIVSMSGVAGSGGYWVAMSADAIVAEPATITGSIGVISLKPNIEKLAADYGANFDRILFGANAGIDSIGKPFTPAERERLSAQMDEVYNAFKVGVADGRNMTVEAVEKIAQGRVWSGAQAKDLGLVDQLGGIDVAQAVIREKLKLNADAPLDLVVFPKPPGLLESISRSLGGGGEDTRVDMLALLGRDPQLARLVKAAQPYLLALTLSLDGGPLVLTSVPVDLR